MYFDTVKQLQLGNAVQVESLEQLLSQSDVVSLHVPAIPSTRNMINGQALSLMKPSAFLINNARGSVVDLDSLAEAIENKTLGGCAIDVFPDEPASNADPFTSPLQKLDNVILTPHTAGSTEEAQENIGIEVALKLVNSLDTGSTSTAVNMPDVELPAMPPADHGVCRIIHMHKNQPGMLSQINSATAHCEANVVGQYLQSNPSHSYLAIDIEGAEEARRTELLAELREIEGTIFTRLIL
jgi:D-3-phosphoglycerate dehydrogenase